MFIVSNRLPINVIKISDKLSYCPSVGGLATGLASFSSAYKSQWIGWPGIADDEITKRQKQQIIHDLHQKNCFPVFLSRQEVEDFYEGFCNKTIWPLFHYFPLYTVYEDSFWQAYKRINHYFCDIIVQTAKPDDCIWIHDYQLMLLPELVRKKLPHAKIGFFLHIPFPSFELFRILPWREEILHGLLGADLIGFHTYDYVRHFLSSACRILGLDHSMGSLTIANRIVKVDAFPMGIDYERYSGAVHKPKVQKNLTAIRKKVGDRKIIVSIDRLDYTKGIVQRLEAFRLFLRDNPRYKEKVTLILLAVPSRTGVDDYQALRQQLEGLVGRINGEHGTIGWVPVWYLYRAVPFEKLISLYHVADVALITPLRDGMNLIAKEFIATKTDGTGVLILSEMAGAASELGEAIIINANDKESVAHAIKQALEMPLDEQIQRNHFMQQRLSRYNVTRWAHDFIDMLTEVKKVQQRISVHKLTAPRLKKLTLDYHQSENRLLLLDYDGTLVSFADRPERAGPDNELLTLLEQLAHDRRNNLVIISGRDKNTLEHWLGSLGASLIAEHGAWIREKNHPWKVIELLQDDWKATIRPILELYSDRTPGSAIEEKNFSLVWHFRRSDPELAYIRSQELKDTILNFTTNLNIGVYEGSKIIEVKNIHINKGRAAQIWLANQNLDFILAAGDDYTDEDLFSALPNSAYSIKIGYSISHAKFNLDSVQDFRLLLQNLINKPENF